MEMTEMDTASEGSVPGVPLLLVAEMITGLYRGQPGEGITGADASAETPVAGRPETVASFGRRFKPVPGGELQIGRSAEL